MKIVFDSNVVIAAFGTRGLCDSLLEEALENHRVVLSEELLQEIQKALQKKFRMPPLEVKSAIAFLKQYSAMETPEALPRDTCRDPDDVKVLGLAVAASADLIITGDKDLLTLKEFRKIPILSPREFLNRQGRRS